MDKIQKGIIALLKSSVTQEKMLLPDGFDIEAAYPLINRHHIWTMVYDGARRCGIDSKSGTMRKLFAVYCNMMMISENQLKDIERIFAAFDADEIDYMPLKGYLLKKLYPKQEFRLMGDADILIRIDQYSRIKPILESLQFEEGQESDHELIWTTPALYLELHKRLIPSNNKDFFEYFGDGWQLAKVSQGTCYRMSPEDEFVFLFTHFAKHYRDGGIGLRHVTDLWVYLRAFPSMDNSYIRQKLEDLALLSFYDNILELIGCWYEDKPASEKTDFITEFIFNSGSWGDMESRVLSETVILNGENMISKVDGRFLYILQCIFPPRKRIQYEYPILNKLPIILPFVWIGRLVRKLVVERGAIVRKKRQLSALNPSNIQNKQEALQYVGLEYIVE